MKSLIVILFSILLSNNILAETKMKPEVTDNFSDRIKDIKNVDGNLEVSFQLHAAIYKISKDNPKFQEISKILESKKGSKDKIKITSSIPSMEIKEVTEK